MSRIRGVLALFLGLLLAVGAAPGAVAQDGDTGAPSEEATPEAPTGDDAGGPADPGAEGAPPGEETPPAEVIPEAQAEQVDECVERVVEDEVQVVGVDTDDFPEVTLSVAVPPGFSGDLGQTNFALAEAGEERSASVTKLNDRIEIMLVIDVSGSMQGAPIDSARAAARSFVEQVTDQADIGVLSFGNDVAEVSPLGGPRGAALAAIDALAAGGETSLYDGLVAAGEALGDTDAPKFVVVLSDGADTASAADVAGATAALRETGANLYAVTLQSPDADFASLEGIAQSVDGRVVSAAGADDLASVYEDLANRLSNQYRMTFTARSGGATDLTVSVYDPARCLTAFVATTEALPDVPGGATDNGGDDDGAGTGTGAGGGDGDGTASPELPSLGAAPAPIEGTEAAAPGSPLAQGYMLWLGAGALFLTFGGLIFAVLSREPSRPSAFKRLDFKNVSSHRSGLASIADRAANVTDRVLEQRSARGKLDTALEQAGKDMRPGEFVLISAGITVAGGIGGFLFMGFRGFLAGLVLGFLFSRRRLSRARAKRQKAFANQLGDTLLMISGSIRAGHGVVEAIDTVASQAESPTGEEFSRVVAETRIGRDLTDALYDVASRTGSEDFIWVVRAIAINRELGGDLAEVLDNTGETIRDRNRLRDQVKALSAEGRVSAYILFALPILVAAWVRFSNPEYMNSMTDTTPGKIVFAFAGFLMVIGGLWLKKLVAVKF
jgi:tight adherence protein B